MKYTLLDDLAKYLNLTYVSELKHQNSKRFKQYIKDIPEATYTLDDWRDACAYLSGVTNGIDTIDDARHKIVEWLNS